MISRTSSTSLADAHERQRDEVDAEVAARSAGPRCPSPTARARDTATPGRLMPLLLLTVPADHDLGVHVGAVDLGDPQPDLAVVDQDRVAGVDVAGQAVVRRAADRARRPATSRVVIVNAWPSLERDRAVGERAEPDLGALQVGEDRRRRARSRRRPRAPCR